MPETFGAERLRGRLESKVSPEPTSGCHLWTAAHNSDGYPVVFLGRSDGRKVIGYAHRVAVELAGRSIGPGLTVDHVCRVRSCINPQHLEIVTFAENVRRREAAR